MIERNCFDFCCFPVMEERNKKTEAQLREFQMRYGQNELIDNFHILKFGF